VLEDTYFLLFIIIIYFILSWASPPPPSPARARVVNAQARKASAGCKDDGAFDPYAASAAYRSVPGADGALVAPPPQGLLSYFYVDAASAARTGSSSVAAMVAEACKALGSSATTTTTAAAAAAAAVGSQQSLCGRPLESVKASFPSGAPLGVVEEELEAVAFDEEEDLPTAAPSMAQAGVALAPPPAPAPSGTSSPEAAAAPPAPAAGALPFGGVGLIATVWDASAQDSTASSKGPTVFRVDLHRTAGGAVAFASLSKALAERLEQVLCVNDQEAAAGVEVLAKGVAEIAVTPAQEKAPPKAALVEETVLADAADDVF
jgi:hypothetical protein